MILMTLYATGVRRAELAHLRVSDIDSERMIIRVRGGKGLKDREVMLSPVLLEALRDHWRRHKPKEWLFPGGSWHNSIIPITPKVAWQACRQAAKRAGLEKKVHPHVLRHALQLICWKTAPICVPFSCCWGTAISKRRRAISTYRSNI